MKHYIEEGNFEETTNLANVNPSILELEEIEPHNEVTHIVKEMKTKRKIVCLELGGNHGVMNNDLTSKSQLCEPQMDAIQIKNFGIESEHIPDMDTIKQSTHVTLTPDQPFRETIKN